MSWPTNGSVMILNASAENFVVGRRGRVVSSSSTPRPAGCPSEPAGNSMTGVEHRCTPLFLNAVPQNIGTITAMVRRRMPGLMSAASRACLSRYLFIRSSLAFGRRFRPCSRHFGLCL